MFLKLTTLALTALIAIPGGAHLFELPGKIGLGQDDYFTVQGIYAGWAWFGVPMIAAILANVALGVSEWGLDRTASVSAFVAASLIAISLGVFFLFVFPGNQATANWTETPENWEALRRSWEYGHAANAVIVFAALLATGRAIAGPSAEAF
ncbi:MAG: DUF1772 domain-containing protein [Mesorhizobium sp.]|nr:DUF1772 domain-containing protein [Mesorhizobium sp.]